MSLALSLVEMEADLIGILQHWRANEGEVSNRILYGSVFTLAVGSNFGAYSFVYVNSSPLSARPMLMNQVLSIISWIAMAKHLTSKRTCGLFHRIHQMEYRPCDYYHVGGVFGGRCGGLCDV